MTTDPTDDKLQRAAHYLTQRGTTYMDNAATAATGDEAKTPRAMSRARIVAGGAVVAAVLAGSALTAAAITGSLPVSLPIFGSDETSTPEAATPEGEVRSEDGGSDETGGSESTTATTTPEADQDGATPADIVERALQIVRLNRLSALGDTAQPDDVSILPVPEDPTYPVRITAVDIPATLDAGSTLRVSWTVIGPSTASWMYVGGPSGWVSWCGFPQPGNPSGGDGVSEVRYEATCEVPASTPNSTYGVWIDAEGFRETDVDRIAGGEFTVMGGSNDTAPPVMTLLSVSAGGPSAGGILRPGGEILVRWQVTDGTGVASTYPLLGGPSGFFVNLDTGEPWGTWTEGRLVSGTNTDGVYEATIRLSDTAPFGTYSVWFGARDLVENRVFQDATYRDGTPGRFELRELR